MTHVYYENALETKGLSKHFGGVAAVDHLSIVIKRGSITSIIGPNGSGKSTLVNILSGVIEKDAGRVIVAGKETPKKVPTHKVRTLGITRTFQEVRLWNQMSVMDNLLVAVTEQSWWGALISRHTKEHEREAEHLLKKVGLWEKRNALANNLSYGERKLLEIARALAMKAEIILFDEPYAGLFPHMIETVTTTLEGLRSEGKTIILIEHNMNIVRKLSDYVIVLDSGKLLAEGEPVEVLQRKEVIEAYLGT